MTGKKVYVEILRKFSNGTNRTVIGIKDVTLDFDKYDISELLWILHYSPAEVRKLNLVRHNKP